MHIIKKHIVYALCLLNAVTHLTGSPLTFRISHLPHQDGTHVVINGPIIHRISPNTSEYSRYGDHTTHATRTLAQRARTYLWWGVAGSISSVALVGLLSCAGGILTVTFCCSTGTRCIGMVTAFSHGVYRWCIEKPYYMGKALASTLIIENYLPDDTADTEEELCAAGS